MTPERTNQPLQTFTHPSNTHRFWARTRWWIYPPDVLKQSGFLPLLLSTLLAEVSGNIVYVVLLEKAFQVGGRAANVGGLFLVQAIPQVLLGVWAGSLVDRTGKCRATILATLAGAVLVAGLAVGQTIMVVYFLAFLFMLARLVLTPGRLALVSQVSSKANLMAANTALTIVIGFGILLGPAISAILTLRTGGFLVPLLVAAAGFMLAVLPLLAVSVPTTSERAIERSGSRYEMRIGWQFIRRHKSIWQVLVCLVHIMLIMGAIMPLLTPLAHEVGLGSEGSGVFFSVVGFGGLIGAPLAVALAKRLSLSVMLLLSGLLVPAGALFIGAIPGLESAMVAIALIQLAEASLSIIVISILQRLTPSRIQGYVFGVQQMLLGLAWVISLAMTTGGMSILPQAASMRPLFLIIGVVGILAILTCWFLYRHQIHAECKRCEPRVTVLGVVCQAICDGQSWLGDATRRLICGQQLRCGY